LPEKRAGLWKVGVSHKGSGKSLGKRAIAKPAVFRYTVNRNKKARKAAATFRPYRNSAADEKQEEREMASLSLKNIYKVYPNGFEAVKDFNLEIADKEFIIFVGPSGCGKSTTLRMVAGLEEISSGELKIGDRVVNDVEPKDRDIAMVFQNYALYPHMTVYDNMAFGLKLRKVPKPEIDRMVKEAAKILDLEKLLDRKPKQLSGGQRQRVAMGRAIVRNPKVFLMDEPLSNLDAKLRVQMRIEIAKLHERLGATIIYVTHDQTEAMTLGTRIVVMKDGVVQQVDTPQNLYNRPDNLFVAGFIGSPQMNFFDAKCTVSGGKVVLEVGSNKITLSEEKSKALIDGGYEGKTVVMGIRPEDVHDAQMKSYDSIIEAPVKVYELLGAEVYLYSEVEGANMTARVDPRTTAKAGDTVKFGLDTEKIHVFDKETEKAIVH
jgi:multiple sugar transport system ATP-binding protein